jgi:hypothetical protein
MRNAARAGSLVGAGICLAALALVAGSPAGAAPLEPVRVRIVAVDLLSEPARYQLLVECGDRSLSRLDAGLILPQGVTSAQIDFGGCTQVETGGWTCATASRLGPTVNGPQTVAVGPGSPFVAPGRSDTLYATLRGKPLLCLNGESRPLAEIRIANLPGNPAPMLVATTQRIDDVFQQPQALDGNGQPVPIDQISYETGPATDQVRVIVRRLPSGTQGSPTHRFEVVLDGTAPLSRVTIGLLVPQGLTAAQVKFGGCTIPTSSNLAERLCATNSPDLGINVDPSASRTLGPSPGFASQGARTDAIYAVLSGARDIGSPGRVLNPTGRPVRLGVVEIDPTVPGAFEDKLPSYTTFGIPGPFLPPWLDPDLELVPVSGSAGCHPRAAPDGDGDDHPDDEDLCPHFWQLDATADTDRDERGDECECSDQNRDGRHGVADLVAINQAIFNPALVTPLCDTNNDTRCNVVDIVGANAELFSVGHTATCGRSPVPDPR